MSSSLHELATQAFALDPADRLRLATELIDSVEGPAESGWTASWREELCRRSAAADGRSVRGSSWVDARARLLSGLTEK